MADEPAAPAEGAQTTAGDALAATAATPPVAGGAPDKTFTQADIDKIVTDRLARQKAQFGDIDDLRAKAARLEELENEKRTDGEKLVAATEKANQKAAEAEERSRKTLEQANERLKRAAVIAEASKAGAVDGEDVYRLLDASKLEVDDDGNVQGVDIAVKGLLDAKPHLIGRAAGRPTPGHFDGGATGVPGTPGMNELIRGAITGT